MEKIKIFLEEAKNSHSVVTIVVSDPEGEAYTQRGKIIDFDENFVEMQSLSNKILIRLDSILKIKTRDEIGF